MYLPSQPSEILYGKRLGRSSHTIPSLHKPLSIYGLWLDTMIYYYHDRTYCPLSILADIQHILSSNDPAVEISDDDTLAIDRRLDDFLLQFQV